jgi:hypothetical protein
MQKRLYISVDEICELIIENKISVQLIKGNNGWNKVMAIGHFTGKIVKIEV